MIGRGADAVGCAHCEAMGGVEECRVCGRIVCKACAADWTTCDQPVARVFRLGLAARLRDVDPSGRLGLVSRGAGPLRLIDLRQLCWIAAPPLPNYRLGDVPAERLTGDGRLVYPEFRDLREMLAIRPIRGGDEYCYQVTRPAHAASVLASGHYSYVSSEETVEIIELAALTVVPAGPPPPPPPPPTTMPMFGAGFLERLHAAAPEPAPEPPADWPPRAPSLGFAPFPGRVVQSACVANDAHGLIVASGTWQRIALHRITGDRRELVASMATDGDVRWIGIAGATLAAAVSSHRVVTWRVADSGAIGPMISTFGHHKPITAAAISRDGQYLAFGFDRGKVAIHSVADGTTDELDDHSDTVSLVRFAGDDQLLITADDDNRVIVRPRGADGYARVTVKAELGEAAALTP